MDADELKDRTKAFALRAIKLCASLPRDDTCNVIRRQLLRAATSVGANYRSACRARSRADFVSKMGIVEEEADECGYWMELLVESGQIDVERIARLLEEADALTAIAAASRKTARVGAKQGSTPQNRNPEIDNRQFR